jgi:hypothetical protein
MPENGLFRFPSSLLWVTQSLLPSYRFPSSPPATRHLGKPVLAPRWRYQILHQSLLYSFGVGVAIGIGIDGLGVFRLQGTIFDADTDPELWFSDLFQGDVVGC